MNKFTAAHESSRCRPLRGGLAALGEALVDRVDGFYAPGGAPFNVARHVAALGQAAVCIGRIGSDDAGGQLVRASAQRFGLSLAPLQRDEQWGTGHADVFRSNGELSYRIASPAAWDRLELAPARDMLAQWGPAIVCFGTLALRAETSRRAILSLLDETPALRLLDLNLRRGQDNRPLAAEALRRADWLKVNADELAHLIVWFVPQADPTAARGSAEQQRAVAALVERYAIERLVVTHGADGYDAFDAQGQRDLYAPKAPAVQVVDAVGAGDAFCGALAALTLAGRPLCEALPLANRYAAATCAEQGPLPDDDEFFVAWRWVLDLPLLAA